MKVFDSFALGMPAEADILLIRLRELAGVVDKHVIVEGDVTFTGQPREMLWPQLIRLPDFQPFVEKVSWHAVTLTTSTAWDRDKEQRDHLLDFVDDAGCSRDDLVIVADCDEIPHPSAIYYAKAQRGLTKLVGCYHEMALDLVSAGSPDHDWEFRQPIAGKRHLMRSWWVVRARQRHSAVAPNIGWHFSCQGGPEAVADKLRSFAHEEFSWMQADDIRDRIRRRIDVVGRGLIEQVPLAALPQAVQDDPERFAHLMLAHVETM